MAGGGEGGGKGWEFPLDHFILVQGNGPNLYVRLHPMGLLPIPPRNEKGKTATKLIPRFLQKCLYFHSSQKPFS